MAGRQNMSFEIWINRKNIQNLEIIEDALFSFQNRAKVEIEIELKAL